MRWQLLIGSVTLLVAPPSLAETFTVHPDGTGDYPTIQAAINVAVDGDVILLGDGVFTGSGNNEIEFLGKAIHLKAEAGGPETCAIDGGTSIRDYASLLARALNAESRAFRSGTWSA
jgi:hypothetical protein